MTFTLATVIVGNDDFAGAGDGNLLTPALVT